MVAGRRRPSWRPSQTPMFPTHPDSGASLQSSIRTTYKDKKTNDKCPISPDQSQAEYAPAVLGLDLGAPRQTFPTFSTFSTFPTFLLPGRSTGFTPRRGRQGIAWPLRSFLPVALTGRRPYPPPPRRYSPPPSRKAHINSMRK